MTGLVVRVITEQAGGYQSHVERGLSAGIRRNEHLSFLLAVRERRTVDEFTVTCLGKLHQTLIKILLVGSGLHVVQDDIHIRTVKTYVLSCAVVGNLVVEGGQLRHFYKVAETFLLHDSIGHVELVVGGLFGIDGCPSIEAMDALLLHRLGTQVLEQQVKFRQAVADGGA